MIIAWVTGTLNHVDISASNVIADFNREFTVTEFDDFKTTYFGVKTITNSLRKFRVGATGKNKNLARCRHDLIVQNFFF